MKRTYIIGVLALALGLTACEDYTEHNFGRDEELWQPTQVMAIQTELTDANYADVAASADNVALALKADTDSTTLRDLQSVAERKYFRRGVTPEAYLPAILKTLVGTSQYYALNIGSTVTVRCRQAADSLAQGAAYVPATSMKAGRYLLVPEGTDLALDCLPEGKTYGYANAAAVARLSADAIVKSADSDAHLYTFTAQDGHYLIQSPDGMYLYMDETHNSFNITDDPMGDTDDPAQALWDVAKADDGRWDIVNVYSHKTLLYGTQYNSAGAYADKRGTEGYLSVELYKEGTVAVLTDATPETRDVTFTLDEDGWAAKSDYLNQELTTANTTDAAEIAAQYGWTIQYNSSLGDLNYVWSATTSYGLKASAFKNSTNFPTDARIISPVMNLKKATEPLFTFQEAQKYSPTPVGDYLRIEVTTDGTTWTDETARLLNPRPDGSSWNFVSQRLDLTPYAGQPTVQVAFRYISTDKNAATWEFKNVRCAEKSEFDDAE